ncbi:MAG: hypothetical protein CNC05_03780 [Pelagibacterales bacterium MED-G42]|nr:MAG: hypothetical protein CNC05_03780 [Pelagibacterales bacterium MED-G42]|tara:strand:- start:124 stop:597 length:474 start_codon:yes stop_codon:yes gene_type:complete
MIEQIYNYFTIDTMYYWVNLGVLPFWFMLIFFPKSHLCKFFVTSIFPIIVLSIAYLLIVYKAYHDSYNFVENFDLYLGLRYISELFSDDTYLIFFWIHFITINLFVGGWIVRDSNKYNINKIVLAFPLIFTYLIGPIGMFLYWLIKFFYARSFDLFE